MIVVEEKDGTQLVPGPMRPLRIMYDDVAIQSLAQENMFALESGDDKPANEDAFYIVLIEELCRPITLEEERPDEIKDIRVHNLIKARSMHEAIQIFEQENMPRLWVSGGQTEKGESKRYVQQIGIPRIAARLSASSRDIPCVRIERVRKDCCFTY